MNDDELCRIVADLVKDCENYRDDRSKDRTRAMEYYDGTMADTPADQGRSQVVSRDVRAEIKKVIPSIARVLLRSDQMVEYLPTGRDDEAKAQQATDYVNYLALPESDAKTVVLDAINDAALLRNGIIKWWWDSKVEATYSRHSGLTDLAFAQLVADEDVEPTEHTERQEMVDDGSEQGIPVTLHDVAIKRRVRKQRARLGCVEQQNWLIHPDATTILEATICGENYRIRRSDLVAMGYDRDFVDNLPASGSTQTEAQEIEQQTRRREPTMYDQQAAKAMQEVEYYELLVRIDYDDDGIAELRRLVFAGGILAKYMLENDEWDEVNYADIVCERRPHQWEGTSIFDDTADIQRIKTVLLRQTLDNSYWQNNLQPIVQEDQIVNPESVTNPAFGLPIRVRNGVDVRQAVGYNIVPMIADKTFAMLAYLDEEKKDRTGITDASGGLAPDALQNMTAKASAMIEQQGIGQTEMITSTIAECLKPVFRGLLKLIIQHQDVPRTVRLRGEWVDFDPRTWNSGMDVTVNTGLGAGTRERDLLAMQVVTGAQEKLLAAYGPLDNPFVKPEQVYNSVSKMVQAAGLKSVDQYFTQPQPQEIDALKQAAADKPSPEMEKAQGQVLVEQAKGQIRLAETDKKMVAEANKEREQRDADLIIKQAELEKESRAAEHQSYLDAQRDTAKLQIEREKIESNERIAMMRIRSDVSIARQNAIRTAASPTSGEDDESSGFVPGTDPMEDIKAVVANLAGNLETIGRMLAAPKVLMRDGSGNIVGSRPSFDGAEP